MLGYGHARFLGMRTVIQTDGIDAAEINWGKHPKRSNYLVRGFKISVGFLLNQKSLTLLVKSAKAHLSGLVKVSENSHPCSIS